MSRTLTPSPRTVSALIALTVALGVALMLVAGGARPARAASPSRLRQQVSSGQGQVSALSGAVSSASQRADQLSAGATALESQVMRLQAGLNAKSAQLLKLRSELDAAKTRLAQLEAGEARADAVLSQQLVGSYEADRPDLVSVVLEATGFSNLLERLSFEQRIGHQDARIAGRVKAARRAVAAQATRLGVLSERQQGLTTQVLYERNRVARDRIALVDQEIAAVHVRDAKAGQLSAARSQLASLHVQLNRALAAQAAAPRVQPSAGSGGFTFPMPKADVSPPSTWSLDDGIDISAPGGTPELAVCSGTVVLHGIGGFGPSAPVIHCDSPLAGYDYVYYGHAGPGNRTPVGTHVSRGQVISQVGDGIVGISTGPHLEIGFADSGGSPIGPSSAPAMASLLHAAYGG